jgi:transcriptional regulator with XRE-family HTH domain
VRYRLRKQLAEFLNRKRGDQTFQQFARKMGLSDSTLQRIEMMEQNVTIDTLQHIVNRLGCRVSDISGIDAYQYARAGSALPFHNGLHIRLPIFKNSLSPGVIAFALSRFSSEKVSVTFWPAFAQ